MKGVFRVVKESDYELITAPRKMGSKKSWRKKGICRF